jgi:hypothetical protein
MFFRGKTSIAHHYTPAMSFGKWLSAFLIMTALAFPAPGAGGWDFVQDYDVTWNTLGTNENDSMPIGNGNLAANVWTETNGDVGDHTGQRRDDVGGIQSAAQAGFPDDQVAVLPGEKFQGHHGDHFKKCRVVAGRKLPEQRLQFGHQSHHVVFRDPLPVDLNPLAKRDQMRRGEQAGAPSRRAVNALQHRAGRAFAVGAGHVNEAQPRLRIARQCSCPARTSRRTTAGRRETEWLRNTSHADSVTNADRFGHFLLGVASGGGPSENFRLLSQQLGPAGMLVNQFSNALWR